MERLRWNCIKVNKPVCDLSLNTADSWMDGLSHLMRMLSLGDGVCVCPRRGFFFTCEKSKFRSQKLVRHQTETLWFYLHVSLNKGGKTLGVSSFCLVNQSELLLTSFTGCQRLNTAAALSCQTAVTGCIRATLLFFHLLICRIPPGSFLFHFLQDFNWSKH